MGRLPSGTVTFLFTDIEGSTGLWEKHPEAMKDALARHDSILRQAIESNGGQVIKATGDGFHGVFEKAMDAVHATLAAQRFLKWLAGIAQVLIDRGHQSTHSVRGNGEGLARRKQLLQYVADPLNLHSARLCCGHGPL